MKNRMQICTSPTETPVVTNGIGDNLRVSLRQKVHAGPTQVLDRRVIMIMDVDEAFNVAMQILRQLPVLKLSEKKRLDQIRELVKILEAGEEVLHG